jgi:hypothetical protein
VWERQTVQALSRKAWEEVSAPVVTHRCRQKTLLGQLATVSVYTEPLRAPLPGRCRVVPLSQARRPDRDDSPRIRRALGETRCPSPRASADSERNERGRPSLLCLTTTSNILHHHPTENQQISHRKCQTSPLPACGCGGPKALPSWRPRGRLVYALYSMRQRHRTRMAIGA